MFSEKFAVEVATFDAWFKENKFVCEKDCCDVDISDVINKVAETFEEPGRNKLDKLLKNFIENGYKIILYENEKIENEKDTKTIIKYMKRDAPKAVKPEKVRNTKIKKIVAEPVIPVSVNFVLNNDINTDACDYLDTLDMITDDLVEIFGMPVKSNIPDDRHRYEWKFQASNGDVYHLYDWKYDEDPNFQDFTEADWHIGCSNPDADKSFIWSFMNSKFDELQAKYDEYNKYDNEEI